MSPIHLIVMFFMYAKRIFYVPAYIEFVIHNKKYTQDFVIWKKYLELNSWSDFCTFFRLFAAFKEYRNVFYFRMGFDSRIISWLAPEDPTIHIPCNSIGEGFYINHGHSSQINAKSIGSNFQMWHNVTIGVKTQFDNNSRPIIGDNVKICSGACVCGDITIGNNVTIGANSVVMKSVPDNSVVAGNPARIIYRDGQRVNEKL